MNDILPEWSSDLRTHRLFIYCEAIRPEAFPLPKGAHGTKTPEFEPRDVRALYRHFDRFEAARARIPQIR